ncbi:MAG: hypothetical protein RMH75_01405 [Archaeoglobaceae archaeon]|nr:hypothetical protein [Archaeoglobaceae archaeon]MDW7989317.1 hypothetical protein [Archaeoglobaceae archaeon]
MMDTKFFEEAFRTAKVFNEFLLTLMNPRTYLRELEDREIEEFYHKNAKLLFELNKAYWGFLIEITQALARRDSGGVVRAVTATMERLEIIYAEYMDNAVISAIINSINNAYLRSLQSLQNFMSAFLHSMGMVSRKDIIALSEAYVDLKGDIKKETRKIREDIRSLREEIEKIKGGG